MMTCFSSTKARDPKMKAPMKILAIMISYEKMRFLEIGNEVYLLIACVEVG